MEDRLRARRAARPRSRSTDATGEVTPPRPPRPETNARLMRRLHDGTGMGLVWQIVIFIGGIIPALLAITGLVMWWRSRGWKAALKRKREAQDAGAAAGGISDVIPAKAGIPGPEFRLLSTRPRPSPG